MSKVTLVVPEAPGLAAAVTAGQRKSGKHSAVIQTFGATKAVTRPLKLRDGTLARSVEDFKRR
jgi:hypothetical protein